MVGPFKKYVTTNIAILTPLCHTLSTFCPPFYPCHSLKSDGKIKYFHRMTTWSQKIYHHEKYFWKCDENFWPPYVTLLSGLWPISPFGEWHTFKQPILRPGEVVNKKKHIILVIFNVFRDNLICFVIILIRMPTYYCNISISQEEWLIVWSSANFKEKAHFKDAEPL